MKLATFKSGGQEKVAIVHGDDGKLFDLAAAASRNGSADPAFASMLALIDAGDAALERAAKLLDKHANDEGLSVLTGGSEILAPVPEPRQMRDGMGKKREALPRGHRNRWDEFEYLVVTLERQQAKKDKKANRASEGGKLADPEIEKLLKQEQNLPSLDRWKTHGT